MGTYAYAYFDRASVTALHQFTKSLHIPNAVRPDKMHVTILHSEKTLDRYVPAEKYATIVQATPLELVVWETATDPCLVLLLDCVAMEQHHKFLLNKHQTTHNFPTYIPHVTLSYNISNYDVSALAGCAQIIPVLNMVGERSEPLDLCTNIKSCTINKTVDSFAVAAI